MKSTGTGIRYRKAPNMSRTRNSESLRRSASVSPKGSRRGCVGCGGSRSGGRKNRNSRRK